jgi:hypothetical protein
MAAIDKENEAIVGCGKTPLRGWAIARTRPEGTAFGQNISFLFQLFMRLEELRSPHFPIRDRRAKPRPRSRLSAASYTGEPRKSDMLWISIFSLTFCLQCAQIADIPTL